MHKNTPNNSSATISVGTGPLFLLFLVFLVLKLTGTITWSWWWVTAPLWMPFAAFLGFIGIFIAIAILTLIIGGPIYLIAKKIF